MTSSVRVSVLAHRGAIALAVVLAGFAVFAVTVGFGAIDLLGPGDPDNSRRILAMTVAHMVAVPAWAGAAVLLWRRMTAGRVLAAGLAVVYFAINAFGRDSMFSIMVTMYIHDVGWGSGVVIGERPGVRITAAAAVLAALVLMLVLISLLAGRRQNRPGPAPIGYAHPGPAGHVDGNPGPATPPHHPYR